MNALDEPMPNSTRPQISTPGEGAVAKTIAPSDRHRRARQQAEAGAEPVERHAERNLHRREGEEEHARHQPDLGRRHAEFARQVGGDHADRIAQELTDDIDRNQRADERNDGGAGVRRLRTARWHKHERVPGPAG